MCTMCIYGVLRDQKRVLNPLELQELPVLKSCPAGAGNWTWFFWKNSSEPSVVPGWIIFSLFPLSACIITLGFKVHVFEIWWSGLYFSPALSWLTSSSLSSHSTSSCHCRCTAPSLTTVTLNLVIYSFWNFTITCLLAWGRESRFPFVHKAQHSLKVLWTFTVTYFFDYSPFCFLIVWYLLVSFYKMEIVFGFFLYLFWIAYDLKPSPCISLKFHFVKIIINDFDFFR